MNLIRYYNQNRKKIHGILIIIISAFIVLQLVNYGYKVSNEKKQTITNNTQIKSETGTTQLTTNKSVITGERLSKDQLETQTKIIDDFFTYCNNQEIEKAYNLLTEECKEQIYYTQEVFEEAYYNNIFKGEKKTCTLENWAGNTYQVKIRDDMLATGKNTGETKQDYITIKQENDQYKININSYIGQKQINRTTEANGIKMEVLSKNTYKEYEEYKLKITNYTENEILLDSQIDSKTLYLQDKKGVKYSSYSHELTKPMLRLGRKTNKRNNH